MIDGKLRQIFREELPQFHWQSIESGMTGAGIPDSNFCCRGVEGWVEFKRTEGWAVNLSPFQVGWHLRRGRAGGRTFVAVRRKKTQLWLVRGSLARTLAEKGLRDFPAPSWDGGRAGWPWPEVARLLTGPL